MTLVDLPSWVAYPGGIRGAQVTTTTVVLDGSGEYACLVLRVPKTGNITEIGWFPGTVNAGVVELRVETVDTSGLPSGTLWDTDTNLSGITPTTGTWRLDTLTAPAAVTVGDLIAIKIRYESGTSARVAVWSLPPFGYTGSPYAVINTGSPTKSVASQMFGLLKYDDGSIPFSGMLPAASTTVAVSVSETGTPDEVGMKITVPMRCTVVGVALTANTAARIFDITLYDISDSVLGSITSCDTDWLGDTGVLGVYLFSAPITLEVGTYRLTLSPKSGGSSISIPKVDVDSSGSRAAWFGGTDVMWTERTNAGAWTDTNTRVPIIDLLLSQLDDGAGGGGATFPMLAGRGGPVS